MKVTIEYKATLVKNNCENNVKHYLLHLHHCGIQTLSITTWSLNRIPSLLPDIGETHHQMTGDQIFVWPGLKKSLSQSI